MKNITLQILCCALLSNLAWAANPKISHDLDRADPMSTTEVIVQFSTHSHRGASRYGPKPSVGP